MANPIMQHLFRNYVALIVYIFEVDRPPIFHNVGRMVGWMDGWMVGWSVPPLNS